MNPEDLLDKYEPTIKYFEPSFSDSNRVYAESFDEEELERVDKENTRTQNSKGFTIGPDLFTSMMMDNPIFSKLYLGLPRMLDEFFKELT